MEREAGPESSSSGCKLRAGPKISRRITASLKPDADTRKVVMSVFKSFPLATLKAFGVAAIARIASVPFAWSFLIEIREQSVQPIFCLLKKSRRCFRVVEDPRHDNSQPGAALLLRAEVAVGE